jgi:hypothetical protein|tara:strand:+ start:129 stop:425 length:297 start_codon:yes stop_codon:yes gene_type:complete
MTTSHQTLSKSKETFVLYSCKISYSKFNGNFYWDEETVNTKELIEDFKKKYGTNEPYSQDKKLLIPLPHILKAVIVHLKNEYNYTYKTTQQLLDKLTS